MSGDSKVLSKTDRDLLALAVLKVPWYMVCGDFHRQYGSPRALAARLIELSEAGLVTIRAASPADDRPSVHTLETDAIRNGCYEDFDSSRGSRWEIVATDDGFAAVEDDLAEE